MAPVASEVVSYVEGYMQLQGRGMSLASGGVPRCGDDGNHCDDWPVSYVNAFSSSPALVAYAKEVQANPARVTLLSVSSGAEISGPSTEGNGGLFSKYVAQGLGRASPTSTGTARSPHASSPSGSSRASRAKRSQARWSRSNAGPSCRARRASS